MADYSLLKKTLENIKKIYHTPAHLTSDPLVFIHNYSHPHDKEVVGILASSLAYGRITQILNAIEKLLRVLGPSPAKLIMNLKPENDLKAFAGFSHRFNDGKDISCMIYFLYQILNDYGTIRSFFLKGYSHEHENVKQALESFSERILTLDCSSVFGRKNLPSGTGIPFFFPLPSRGSACKRLNLFLRWMVRKDNLDQGVWNTISPAKLIVPLDTHIGRISRRIGLTNRRSNDWKTAEEITQSIKEFCPHDPVRYDFSLCRLGISGQCQPQKQKEHCVTCELYVVCNEGKNAD